MALQMVRPIFRHLVPQQNRLVQSQVDHFAHLRVLLGLRGTIGLPDRERVHGVQVHALVQESRSSTSHCLVHVCDGYGTVASRLQRCRAADYENRDRRVGESTLARVQFHVNL